MARTSPWLYWVPVLVLLILAVSGAVVVGGIKAVAAAWAQVKTADAAERDTNFWEGVSNTVQTAVGAASAMIL